MKKVNQFSTLEQSKRFDELGILLDPEREYHYEWVEFKTSNGLLFALCLNVMDDTYSWIVVDENVSPEIKEEIHSGEAEDTGKTYTAYSVAELGVMLPDDYQTSQKTAQEETFPECAWICGIIQLDDTSDDGFEYQIFQYGVTEAEARASMLIHLIEYHKTTAVEVNERLNAA